METNYLNDSSTNGNVLKGFEGFLATHKATSCAPVPRPASLASRTALAHSAASPPAPPPLPRARRSVHPSRAAQFFARLKRARNFKTEDRLFSLSSSTSPAVEELEQERIGADARPPAGARRPRPQPFLHSRRAVVARRGH